MKTTDREIIESSTLDKETPIVPLKGDEHANLEKVSSGKNGQTENPPARKGEGQAELVPQTPENSAPASPQLSQGTASQVTDELKLTGEPTEADKFETAKNVIGACFGRKPTSQWKKTALKELKGYLPSLFEELDDKTRKRLEKRISALPGKYVVEGGVCVVKKAKYHSRNNLDLRRSISPTLIQRLANIAVSRQKWCLITFPSRSAGRESTWSENRKTV